jgi:aspartokinase
MTDEQLLLRHSIAKKAIINYPYYTEEHRAMMLEAIDQSLNVIYQSRKNAFDILHEIFEKYKTPVDMITTSEVSVSVTIDQTANIDAIMRELREFAELEDPDRDQVIICIVGNFWADKEGIAIKVLDAIKNIPIRMISYGASEHNISLLVDAKHKNDALNALNEGLF